MKHSAEMKVGVIFFLALALLITFTLLLSDIHLFKREYGISVTFDSVGGLKKGDKVSLGGMEVGRVEKLSQSEGKIRVDLLINDSNQIPRDSAIKLKDVGLLGGKRVDIHWGNPATGFIQEGDQLLGVTSPGISETIASFGATGAKMEKILASLQEVSDRIARGEGTIGKLVQDESLYNDGKKLFSDLQQTVEENRESLQEAFQSFKDAAPRMEKTTKNLEEITDKINKGKGTIGKLVNDEKVYEDARQTMTSVKTASDKLSRMVAKAERIRVYIGAEGVRNFESKHTLSKVYLQIEPISSKVYRVGVSLLSGEGTEADRTDDPDTELDAQIGLRFFSDRLTVRAGLLEGRVGGGLDYLIWPDRLLATVEGRSVWTKEKDEGIDPFLLRAGFEIRLWWGFYAYLGGDNLLDHPGFNAGLGLRLRDEDIKSLFGLISFSQ